MTCCDESSSERTVRNVYGNDRGATLIAGSTFTPTSGRFLVCCVEGAVTSTTATGLLSWRLVGLLHNPRQRRPESPTTSTAVAHAGARGSLIVEALGYLGGILIVVAAVLIAKWYWVGIPT